jgi:phosphoserine phosphatase RsbU/P
MTPLPVSKSSSSSTPSAASSTVTAVTTVANGAPIVALKELVARLNREQYRTQDLLSSLGFALRSFTNLNQFLEIIPLMASRVTEADGGALIVFRPDGQLRLERLHCTNEQLGPNIRQALEQVTQQMSSGQPIAQAGMTALLDDRVSRTLGPNVQLFGTAVLNRTLERGRLYVFSSNPSYAWTERRQKLVRLVADQTAVAIEHDELEAELRQKERLDRELEIGAEIQRRLLPRSCPQIDGLSMAARCQTANRVGGDYYDFVPMKGEMIRLTRGETQAEDRLSIAIGDVMGKGVPAGLIMTMLRGMLRAEVFNGHPPANILQHLNQVMFTDLENSNRFVTLFYSEFDPQTRTLSYSNAAHNPPLLWRGSTNTLHRLDTQGMLIGLAEDSEYEDASIQLLSGDIVLFYTDGFTDAANAQGDRFDEENLIEIFRWSCERYDHPQGVLETIFDKVQTFIGPDKRNDDDMTLIVMKVQDESI